jgi:hypothetical protein
MNKINQKSAVRATDPAICLVNPRSDLKKWHGLVILLSHFNA